MEFSREQFSEEELCEGNLHLMLQTLVNVGV